MCTNPKTCKPKNSMVANLLLAVNNLIKTFGWMYEQLYILWNLQMIASEWEEASWTTTKMMTTISRVLAGTVWDFIYMKCSLF